MGGDRVSGIAERSSVWERDGYSAPTLILREGESLKLGPVRILTAKTVSMQAFPASWGTGPKAERADAQLVLDALEQSCCRGQVRLEGKWGERQTSRQRLVAGFGRNVVPAVDTADLQGDVDVARGDEWGSGPLPPRPPCPKCGTDLSRLRPVHRTMPYESDWMNHGLGGLVVAIASVFVTGKQVLVLVCPKCNTMVPCPADVLPRP